MIYSHSQYLIYKLSNLMSSKFVLGLIGLIIVAELVLLFWYDWNTNGPLLRETDGSNNLRSKSRRYFKAGFKELMIALLLVLTVIGFFGIHKISKHAEDPATIEQTGKNKTVATGEIYSVDTTTNQIKVVNKSHPRRTPIIASVSFPGSVKSDTSLLFPYKGLEVSPNNGLNGMKAGKPVKIKVREWKFKYRNHRQFHSNNESLNKEKIKNLNQAHVNGILEKDSKKESNHRKHSNAHLHSFRSSYYDD